MFWNTLETLPEIGERVLVAAWEFGFSPTYYICRYWRSSAPNQPPKFYLDETYSFEVPMEMYPVHFWARIPEVKTEGGL